MHIRQSDFQQRRPNPECRRATQLFGCLPGMLKAWVCSPAPLTPAVVVHAYDPSTQEADAEGPGDQNHPP